MLTLGLIRARAKPSTSKENTIKYEGHYKISSPEKEDLETQNDPWHIKSFEGIHL